jgi:uncharacterized protein YgiM (DUF1202 family)
MPKSLAMVLLPLVCGALSPAFALTPDTVDSSNPGQTPAPRLAQVGTVETMLYFETESRVVRIFRQGSELFMNLYNKATDVVEVNGVPAELVPSSRDQVVYKNSLGEAERFARINALGETELEIIAADGTVVLQEPGFNAVVGVPDGATDFQGNNVAPGNGAIVISREYANLRSEPRLGSDILGSANRREIVQVLERVGNPEDGYLWYRVVYNGTTGWVRGDLLQLA